MKANAAKISRVLAQASASAVAGLNSGTRRVWLNLAVYGFRAYGGFALFRVQYNASAFPIDLHYVDLVQIADLHYIDKFGILCFYKYHIIAILTLK